MSDDQAPLAMTLEEVMLKFGDTDYWLEATPDGRWTFFQDAQGGYNMYGYYATWAEAASRALGRPIVARDEAAELRAENDRLGNAAMMCDLELTELRAAIREWVHADCARRELETESRLAGAATASLEPHDRVVNAEDNLRRLAEMGGEHGQ